VKVPRKRNALVQRFAVAHPFGRGFRPLSDGSAGIALRSPGGQEVHFP
jgi:hypothetical protein